ncbi:relaxase/mobilization nuclease domain-containing protein [Acutalibacter sp. 1XD8-33]|uniref:relaxase/mobilization nuclease domain-containing protein n=1 Tax=Acutalibacter sp. 1XD8-33 TaxID=2320081 RepID=UPI0013143085|nr:relaxase/mobilization nuclease domain-containing protein [Acutalibacter sp. 1XD8-33]
MSRWSACVTACGGSREPCWVQQMAQTKIWKIDHHLGRCIRYIMNPVKTLEGKLVTGVNLFIPPNDWQAPTNQMISTKLRFGKQGGRLAYHLDQSFKPGEVTPDVAHQIGVELAKELFGDKYEVVVATHTDKDHIHSHIILNSVSFVDGRKFHQPNAMYYDRIRKVSDRLCEKYGLSIIKEAKSHKYESYPAQHHQEPQPSPTVHSLMYEDMDRAVETAKDLDDFYRVLAQMGYRVKREGKYPAISPEGHGFSRLYKFKDGYTEEDIRQRIAEKNHSPHRQKPRPVYGAWKNPAEQQAYKKRYTGYYARRYDRRGLNATYLHYRYMLVSIRRQSYPRYPTIEQRKALAKLEKYSQEARLLVRNKIQTGKELSAYQVSLGERIHELHKERWYLKRDLQKNPTWEERQVIEQKISGINQRLKPLYRERSLCKDIEERCGSITAAVNREKESAMGDMARERGDELWTTQQRQ